MERATGPGVKQGLSNGGGSPPPRPRLGMHVSIAGGMAKMAERARDFGCEAVQVFSRSPQGGKARPLPPEEVAAARSVLENSGIFPLVVHTPYFVNLCSSDEGLRAYAVETLAGELERAALLGSPYVVTHLGRPAEGVGLAEGLALAAASVAEAFRRVPGGAEGVTLLLENTAGAGREIGSSLEELAHVVGELGRGAKDRLGVCLDTCHAQAAGYDLGTQAGVRAFSLRAAQLVGPDRVKVVHANDSLGAAGSHLDRHVPVGQGTIGEEGFRALLTDPLLAGCPFLLETPGTDEERATDLVRLRRLRAGEPLA